MHHKYSRELLDAPNELVKNDHYNLGSFNKAIVNVNLLEAPKPLGIPTPNILKNRRLREWQAFQLGNRDHFFMVAIYNTKTIGLAQFIHYNIQLKEKKRYEVEVPFWETKIAQGLDKTTSEYNGRNFKIKAYNNVNAGNIKLSINIDKTKDRVEAQFVGKHTNEVMQPMVVCQPFDDNRVMYSHKGLMPMDGMVTIGEKTLVFNKDDSWMIMDDHKGYYPYHTLYDWVTGASNINGNLLGFNLTDNQVIHQEIYNENCLWMGNTIHLLPPITIKRPHGFESTWIIKDGYGMVDLEFTPVVNTSVHKNYIVVESKYESPYGYFEGFIKDSVGEKHRIDGVFGCGEQFDLKI